MFWLVALLVYYLLQLACTAIGLILFVSGEQRHPTAIILLLVPWLLHNAANTSATVLTNSTFANKIDGLSKALQPRVLINNKWLVGRVRVEVDVLYTLLVLVLWFAFVQEIDTSSGPLHDATTSGKLLVFPVACVGLLSSVLCLFINYKRLIMG